MFCHEQAQPLVLASASLARRQMLVNAGLRFEVEDSGVDEAPLKARLRQAHTPAPDTALALARAKAEAVAMRHPGALVIGADQILVCRGVSYDKPSSAADAEAQLLQLAGQTQQLVTAAVIVTAQGVRWQTVAIPEITLRPFDAAFARQYLAACGDRVLGSVGACQIEHYGVQLLAAVQGDLFSILGLPLLPLLAFLRQDGVIVT